MRMIDVQDTESLRDLHSPGRPTRHERARWTNHGMTSMRRLIVPTIAAVALSVAGCGAAEHHQPDTGETMNQKALIQSTIDAMTSAFNSGDIDGVMRTYEPGAVVVGEPGAPVSGTPALRAMFAGFVAAKAQFNFLGHEIVQAGDIAVHFTPWRMTGVAPDGSPIRADGLSVAVLRRQADGRWLIVIDDPYGDSLLKQADSR